MKVNIYTILIFLLLIVSLFFRLSRLEYPIIHTSKWGDGTRDYLVAHYIRQFGEMPLIGPFNLLFESGIRNSPLYYYILAIFLMPNDNLMTLSVINILLSVLTIGLIYLVGKTFFGNLVGFISALLFSFTPEVLRQSEFIWQPYLMQPFAYLSLFLLIFSFIKKSYMLSILSLATLAFSIALHNAAVSWLPQFILVSFYLIKSLKKGVMFYFAAILTPALVFIVFYIPVIFYFIKLKQHINQYFGSIFLVQSIKNYGDNLVYNFTQIMQVFSIDLSHIPLAVLLIIFLLFLLSIFYFYLQKKILLSLGMSLFLAPIILSSFFNKNQLHYLILSIGTFTILVSKAIVFFFSKLDSLKLKRILSRSLKIIIILFLFKIFSSDFNFLIAETHLGENESLIKSATDAIQNENLNPSSFQIISFASDQTTFRYPILDTILMVPLEKKLNVKLVKISDDSPYSIVQINSDKYIFVACFQFSSHLLISDCRKSFISFYPNHAIVKSVYIRYPLFIYLANRND